MLTMSWLKGRRNKSVVRLVMLYVSNCWGVSRKINGQKVIIAEILILR